MEATATTRADGGTAAGAGHPHRVAALDGLRGLAVAVVVLYHGGHLTGGFLGVDLFFVLSGFLITTALLRSWSGRHRIDLAAFWARRARRLLPALLAMLLIVVPVYAIFFANDFELTQLRRDALSSLVYVTNWQQIFYGQSYWAATLAESPLKHTWSLAVEEQFYVVWPLVALAVLRRRNVRGLRDVAVVGAAAAAAFTTVAAVGGWISLNALYLGTISRSAPILVGAALATWRWRDRKRPARTEPQLELAALAAVAVLAWMWVTVGVSEERLYAWGLLVSAACGGILVAAASSRRPGPIVRVLEVAPLRYLGTISYGIYLWSWPIMQMVDERHTDLEGYPLLAVQLALTMVAAMTSWYLLERPVLAGALPPPRGLQVLLAAMAASAVVTLSVTAGATSADVGDLAESSYTTSAVADAPTLMVVGDSVPGVLARDGIAPLVDELGVSVVNRAVPGCILLRELDEVKGIEGNIRDDVSPCNQTWAADAATYAPDEVLLMFGQFASDEVRIDGEFQLPCQPAYMAAEREALDRGLDDLTSTGAHVTIVTAPWSSVSWVTEAAPGLPERMACLNDLYREVAGERDDVGVVELASYVCPEAGRCLDTIDGINLREDTIHFRDAAAQLVARWMVPQILSGTAAPAPTPEATTTRHPYCAQIATVLAGLEGSTGPEDGPVLQQTLTSLRSVDPEIFLTDVPDEIRPAMETITADWLAYLDRAASLPDEPTPEQVAEAFGPFQGPAIEVSAWIGANC